jgi:hypothetical protein
MQFIVFLCFIISTSSWLVLFAIFRFHFLCRIFSLGFSFQIPTVY